MYFVKLHDGAEIAVQLSQTDRGRWRATTANGNTVELEIKGRGADGAFVLLVDGEQRSVQASPENGGLRLVEDGEAHHLEVVHAADLVLDRPTDAASRMGDEVLTSPITGIVLQIPIELGATVSEGDVVAVVEAMKMENSLGAPRSGVVAEVFAKPGQTVFVGEPLVQIR